jgi:hypothetical protein
MVERVVVSAVESYGIVDIDGCAATPFSSIKIHRVVDKPLSKDALDTL